MTGWRAAEAYPLPLTIDGSDGATWLTAALRSRYPGVTVDHCRRARAHRGHGDEGARRP